MSILSDFIQLSQLDALGFHDKHRTLLFAFIMVLLLYFICKPLVKYLIKGEQIVFLTYLIVSLLSVIAVLNIALIDKQANLPALALQAIGLFGISLSALSLIQHVSRYIKRQFEKRTS
ncbi:MAG TPA: hypothetical protein VFF20_02280 [Pseudogracilibacillus sp.]|nr:hypothetical protein [Pseudogracilibacillus sp.]